MENWVPGLITGGFAVVVAIISGWYVATRELRADRRKSSMPGAPTVQEIWQRQDRLESVTRAALDIVTDVFEQIEDTSSIVLSQRSLHILAENDYLPSKLEHLLEEES